MYVFQFRMLWIKTFWNQGLVFLVQPRYTVIYMFCHISDYPLWCENSHFRRAKGVNVQFSSSFNKYIYIIYTITISVIVLHLPWNYQNFMVKLLVIQHQICSSKITKYLLKAAQWRLAHMQYLVWHVRVLRSLFLW